MVYSFTGKVLSLKCNYSFYENLNLINALNSLLNCFLLFVLLPLYPYNFVSIYPGPVTKEPYAFI